MRIEDNSRNMCITDIRSLRRATLRRDDASLTETTCLTDMTSPAGSTRRKRRGDA